jgi:hypothetical protein
MHTGGDTIFQATEVDWRIKSVTMSYKDQEQT